MAFSRRDFGRNAIALAAMSIVPVEVLGDTASAASRREIHHGKSRSNENVSSGTHAQEVEAKLANIVRKYGDRLSDSQREHLRRVLTYNEELLASIRNFPLQNGDAPSSVLKISSLLPAAGER